MGEETDIAEPMASEDAVATAHGPLKDKLRKRKKLLYKSIRDLMEFYLGDANLRKTRYMFDCIQGQPFVYVDLSLFLTFNKMKLLTSNIEDLAKAISSSEVLQLSEDGTKVCRKTPIGKKDNEEECTIYVEQLSPDVDHDTITKVFSEFGPVDYISVPKFVSNNKNKGFGFVEFTNPESAKKALEAFNARGCCLSPHMAPEQLLSIKNFDPNKESRPNRNDNSEEERVNENEKDLTKDSKKRKNSETDNQLGKKKRKSEACKDFGSLDCDSKNVTEDNDGVSDEEDKNESRKRKKKRKKSAGRENDEEKLDDENSEPPSKKLKAASPEIEPPYFKDNEGKEESEASAAEEENEEGETAKQKKRRKKKKVKKEKSSANSMGFKILSKKDWRHLRNKYLNMQKNTMRSLKQHLSYSYKCERSRQGPMEVERGREAKQEEQPTPGTIIKVTLDEPVTNAKAAKMEMRTHPEIKYVDATESSPYVYLRTSTPEFATTILQAKSWPKMEIILGDEESQYWTKMQMDKEQKSHSKIKQNQRGRTKLLKKAERFQGKHIAFEST